MADDVVEESVESLNDKITEKRAKLEISKSNLARAEKELERIEAKLKDRGIDGAPSLWDTATKEAIEKAKESIRVAGAEEAKDEHELLVLESKQKIKEAKPKDELPSFLKNVVPDESRQKSNDAIPKKRMILSSLKLAVNQIDLEVQWKIKRIASQAEIAKNNPSKMVKMTDANSLKKVLEEADRLIHSQEIAEILLLDTYGAREIRDIISGLQKKIQTLIKEELVDKYEDVPMVDDESSPAEAENVEPENQEASVQTVGDFFGSYVERNIDNYRLDYETTQLNKMKQSQEYAKGTNNPKFKGLDKVFGDVSNICLDMANTNLIFAKMSECTPDKIQAVIAETKKGKYTEADTLAAYKAILGYSKLFIDIESSFKGNSQLVNKKEAVIQRILNGDPEIDKDVPPGLIEAVRIISLQNIYARSLSSDSNDKSFKDFIINEIEYEEKAGLDNILGMLTSFSEEMKNCPDQAKRLNEQRSRALISRIKNIPFINETLGIIIPGFKETMAQSTSQTELSGAVEALYAYMENCSKEYEQGDFEQSISEIEKYIAIAQNENKTIDQLVEEQEKIVQEEKDILAKSQKHIEKKEKLSSSNVKQSKDELDVKHLGEKYGVELFGKIDFSKDEENPDFAHYSKMDSDAKKKVEQSALDALTEYDYGVLRKKAIEEMEQANSKALIPKGSLVRRFGAFLVSKIGRFFKIRNIPTQSEKAINSYIRSNYIKGMMEENEKIQDAYESIEQEAEEIKEEEIALRDGNRERLNRRKNKEKEKDKGKEDTTKDSTRTKEGR